MSTFNDNDTMLEHSDANDHKESLSSTKVMLTTVDNPFDPFDDFDNWFRYDSDHGYNSCSYLARIAKTSEQLSDNENEEEIENAIDEIIKYDFTNLYRKVKKKVKD